MGYKWPEDQSDEFIKEMETKSEKKVNPNDVIKKLMKRWWFPISIILWIIKHFNKNNEKFKNQ